MIVYWMPFADDGERSDVELTYFEPVSAMKAISADRRERSEAADYVSCPGVISFFKNTFAVLCPLDIIIDIDKETGRVIGSNLPDGMQKYVAFRSTPGVDEFLTLSIRFYNLFMPVGDAYVEQMPAFLSHGASMFSVIPGKFNARRWVRPLECSIEVKKTEGRLKINRGDHLYYVRISPFDGSSVSIKRGVVDDETVHVIRSCLAVKKFKKGLSLDSLYALAAPIVNRLFKKCPFRK